MLKTFIHSLSAYLTSKDGIVLPSVLKLHFDNDMRIKTLVGGLTTIVINCYIIYIAVQKTLKMVKYNEPYISSFSFYADEKHEERYVDMSKTMLEIWHGDDSDASGAALFNTVKLDRESRRYIHVRVKNVFQTYDENGVKNETHKYYPVTKCSE